MPKNQQTTDGIEAGQATQQAIDAWSAEMVKTLEQADGMGSTRLAIPLLQAYLDTRLTQLKLEALFEELDHEQLVDAAKVMRRVLRKLDHERQQAKQANDARPTIQAVDGAVAAAINGKHRG